MNDIWKQYRKPREQPEQHWVSIVLQNQYNSSRQLNRRGIHDTEKFVSRLPTATNTSTSNVAHFINSRQQVSVSRIAYGIPTWKHSILVLPHAYTVSSPIGYRSDESNGARTRAPSPIALRHQPGPTPAWAETATFLQSFATNRMRVFTTNMSTAPHVPDTAHVIPPGPSAFQVRNPTHCTGNAFTYKEFVPQRITNVQYLKSYSPQRFINIYIYIQERPFYTFVSKAPPTPPTHNRPEHKLTTDYGNNRGASRVRELPNLYRKVDNPAKPLIRNRIPFLHSSEMYLQITSHYTHNILCFQKPPAAATRNSSFSAWGKLHRFSSHLCVRHMTSFHWCLCLSAWQNITQAHFLCDFYDTMIPCMSSSAISNTTFLTISNVGICQACLVVRIQVYVNRYTW